MKLIKLSHGKFAEVSDEDFDNLNQFKWSYRQGDVLRNKWFKKGTRKDRGDVSSYMHHEIIGRVARTHFVNHKDGNPLNFQRDNLEILHISIRENQKKKRKNCTSIYKGVSWSSGKEKWVSQIKKAGVLYRLGVYEKQEPAALAYDKKSIELYGEFAYQNFPQEVLA